MQSLQAIKSTVFTAIATTSTQAVKQWAEAHGITADLRTKEGWLAVAKAAAQHLKPVAKKAIATTKAAAKAIHEADFEQINDTICAEARAFKVAAVDGAIATYDTLKQYWGPALRFTWEVTKFTVVWLAIASLYCLRAGQRFRSFIGEFEDTGMGPHQIAWYFLKPALKRGRGVVARQWHQVRERAIGLSAQRRVRECAVYVVSGMLAASWLG